MRASIFVLTDISSLTPGVREPDDGQSLIRLLAHASEFDIRGLAATSNLGQGHVTRPELIHQIIDAYAKVQPNLRLHDARYPDADELRARVHAGNPVAGQDVPVFDCIGPGRDTPASDALIAAVDELPKLRKPHCYDLYELWVLAWGGTCDLAQALWRVRNDRSPQELRAFLGALRVHAVYEQDSTGPWIKVEFPDLTYLTHRHAIHGMYRGGDTSLVSPDWVRENIHGHGPLGDLYPVYDGDDMFSDHLGPVRGIKEGGTPTFLRLLPCFPDSPPVVLNPDMPSWGGPFRAVAPRRWEDVGPLPEDAPDDPAPGISAIYRYRAAYQNEFAARMDWCVRPPGQVSLPPKVGVTGGTDYGVSAYGIWVYGPDVLVGEFDASDSVSPDGSPLRFRWEWVPLGEHDPVPFLHGSDSPRLSVVFPPDTPPQDIYLRLSVTTTGDVPLTRYGDNLWTYA